MTDSVTEITFTVVAWDDDLKDLAAAEYRLTTQAVPGLPYLEADDADVEALVDAAIPGFLSCDEALVLLHTERRTFVDISFSSDLVLNDDDDRPEYITLEEAMGVFGARLRASADALRRAIDGSGDAQPPA